MNGALDSVFLAKSAYRLSILLSINFIDDASIDVEMNSALSFSALIAERLRVELRKLLNGCLCLTTCSMIAWSAFT